MNITTEDHSDELLSPKNYIAMKINN